MKRIFVGCLLIGCFAVWSNGQSPLSEPKSDHPQTSNDLLVSAKNNAAEKNSTVKKKNKAVDSEQKKRDPSHWMIKKMKLSTAVFEGIAAEDFEKISKSAREMKVLSKAEHFVRSKPTSYRTHLKVFRFANDELIRAANDENVEAATLAFNQLTVSCVNCHSLIRRAK